MHSATFVTAAATDHVVRALDELARAGFRLESLQISGGEPEQEVQFSFSGAATVTAETYVTRLSRMPGVRDLRLETRAAQAKAACLCNLARCTE